MSNSEIKALQQLFSSRLNTLNHLLDLAEKHFADDIDALLQLRLAPDMFPFGTQIAFVCNQPRGFALWCKGEEVVNLDPEVTSLEQARGYITQTQELLAGIQVDDAQLSQPKHIKLGPEFYLDLEGRVYVQDFLMPNFYFHLSTAYAILRMAGAPLGKGDYMRHLGHLVKQSQPEEV